MLTTVAVAGLVCAASAVVGEAAARLLAREQGQGWSPAVGLGVLLAVAISAVKLPGHGTTAAVALALLIAAAGWVVWSSGVSIRPPLWVVLMSVAVAVIACIPYIANGRWGWLGVGFNNDLSAHLQFVIGLATPDAVGAGPPNTGYPVGPHALLAAFSSGLGIDPGHGFGGLMLALPIIVAWSALPLLDGLSAPRRAAGATLVAFTYSLAEAYTQVGFKEYLLVTFFLGMLGVTRAAARTGPPVPWQTGIQLGLLGGGIVFSFSYGGLVWPAAAAGLWAATSLAAVVIGPANNSAGERVRKWITSLRAGIPALAAALATGAVVVLLDIGRLIDSFSVFGSSPSSTGAITKGNVGNLLGAIPKREIFGIWPREDFRLGLEATTVNDLWTLFALVVVCVAAIWWVLRRDFAVPAAAVSSIVLLTYLSHNESAYTAGKAFAPAAALVMVLAVRPLLEPWPPHTIARVAQVAVVVLFAGGVLWSSYLALRGGRVGPRDHADELADIRPKVEGDEVLFLGKDDYMRAELRDAQVVPPEHLRHGRKYVDYYGNWDIDSAGAREIDDSAWVITSRTAFRSEMPPNLQRVATTDSYELWRRRGPAPRRRTLAEGSRPGARLDCTTPAGRRLRRSGGWARVWTKAPRAFKVSRVPVAVKPGKSLTRGIRLPAGRWELSLDYLSPQTVDIDFGIGRRARLPASTDRPGPFFRFGEVRNARAVTVPVRFTIGSQPLHADSHLADLLRIGAVPLDAKLRLIPLSQACGQYVDWYTLGAKRPRTV